MPSRSRKKRKTRTSKKDPSTAPTSVSCITDLPVDILSKIVVLVGSFTETCRLRRVSSIFHQAVSRALIKNTNLHITDEDIRMGYHVAALRYVARKATGSRVLLASGIYDLGSDDYDIDRHEMVEGLRFGASRGPGRFPGMEVWEEPNRGPLVIKANGLTICPAADGGGGAKIRCRSRCCYDEDPLIFFAVVVVGKSVILNGMATDGNLSLYTTEGSSLVARSCDLRGTATLEGDVVLDECTVRYGVCGGIKVAGTCRVRNCTMFDNSRCTLFDADGDPGLDVINGTGICHVKNSYVLLSMKLLEKDNYDDDDIPEVLYCRWDGIEGKRRAIRRFEERYVEETSSGSIWRGRLKDGTYNPELLESSAESPKPDSGISKRRRTKRDAVVADNIITKLVKGG